MCSGVPYGSAHSVTAAQSPSAGTSSRSSRRIRSTASTALISTDDTSASRFSRPVSRSSAAVCAVIRCSAAR